MQDNQYIFAVARTRVLETKLLNDAFDGLKAIYGGLWE